MKCQICSKNDANIVFTQIINNEKIIMQICTDCAKDKGITVEILNEPPQIVPLAGIMKGILEKEGAETIPDLTCSECGLTFAEFKKSGRFGCDKCHEAFGNHITSLLKQIHGLARHEGKEPQVLSGEVDTKKQLRDLRKKLKRLIELEEYEKAADIRDKINTLEKRIIKK